MKTILVPCDFSKPATDAFRTAINLAERTQGEIILLHVISYPVLYTGLAGEPPIIDPAYYTRTEEDARHELSKLKTEISRGLVPVSIDVQFGDLLTIVLKTINTRNIDIIVMGTSGASGIAEILIGSNTEKVVRFSPVPVLAVRSAMEMNAIKNILLPSTLELNQHAFIDKLKELQRFFHATLHILLINTPIHFRQNRDANAALEDFAKHYHLENYTLRFKNFYREEEGIQEYARAEKIDLVVMPTHARKGLSHLFNPSVTEHVLNHIERPIWTFHLKT